MTDMNPNTPNQPQNFDPTRRLKKSQAPDQKIYRTTESVGSAGSGHADAR